MDVGIVGVGVGAWKCNKIKIFWCQGWYKMFYQVDDCPDVCLYKDNSLCYQCQEASIDQTFNPGVVAKCFSDQG